MELSEVSTLLTPMSALDLVSTQATHFEKAVASSTWTADLEWAAPSVLSSQRQHVAAEIASQSSHAEQIGMLTAATLLLEARDPATRLALATAVRDESIHMHTFGRYASERRGRIAPPLPAHRDVEEWLVDRKLSYGERLLMHTLAEGFATDQFHFLAFAFQEDLLGRIYLGVLSDEARHVAMGLDAVASQIAAGHFQIDIDDAGQRALSSTGAGPAMFEWFSCLADQPYALVRNRYYSHLDGRLHWLRRAAKRKGEALDTSMTSVSTIYAYQSPVSPRGIGKKKPKSTKRTPKKPGKGKKKRGK